MMSPWPKIRSTVALVDGTATDGWQVGKWYVDWYDTKTNTLNTRCLLNCQIPDRAHDG
jgi:hypothetical protein